MESLRHDGLRNAAAVDATGRNTVEAGRDPGVVYPEFQATILLGGIEFNTLRVRHRPPANGSRLRHASAARFVVIERVVKAAGKRNRTVGEDDSDLPPHWDSSETASPTSLK